MGFTESLRLFVARIVWGINSVVTTIYFAIAPWVVLFISILTGVIIMEVVASQTPSLFAFQQLIGATGSAFSFLIAIGHSLFGFLISPLDDGITMKRGMSLMYASGFSLVGHILASVFELFFAPLFALLNILNNLADYILIDEATVEREGLSYPARCEEVDGRFYPRYVVGDIQIIHQTLGLLIDALEADISLCLSDIPAFGPPVAAAVEAAGYSSCGSVGLNDLPGLSQAHSYAISIRDTPIFPADVFDFMFKSIEDFLGYIFPKIGGTDILKHYLFVERLEFNGTSVDTESGSDPFNGFLRNKLEIVMGCQQTNN